MRRDFAKKKAMLLLSKFRDKFSESTTTSSDSINFQRITLLALFVANFFNRSGTPSITIFRQIIVGHNVEISRFRYYPDFTRNQFELFSILPSTSSLCTKPNVAVFT